MALMQVIKISL